MADKYPKILYPGGGDKYVVVKSREEEDMVMGKAAPKVAPAPVTPASPGPSTVPKYKQYRR